MSKKEKKVKIEEIQETNQKPEKTLTKYDLKKQRREAEKAREKREQKMTAAGGVVVLLILVAIVLYAPVNTFLTLHRQYIEVGGEKITKVEYDYNYYVVKNNYINTYGGYLSYFGLDTTKDFSNQMYSETLTWADYFDQLTVDNLTRSKALKKDAQDHGFAHDTDEEYAKFLENVKAAAITDGTKLDAYLKTLFGPYATQSRVEPFVREGLLISAYNDKLTEDNKPSEEDIEAYYQEHREYYDEVDYWQTVVPAQLPTEPTDLAEPLEDGMEAYDPEMGIPYEPSKAEIAKAMNEARVEATREKSKIKENGDLYEGHKREDVDPVAKSWLFDDERQEGDITIITDEDEHSHFVLYFIRKYRDDAPTANVRVMGLKSNGQTVLDKWNEKGATEEAFIELSRQYSTTNYEDDGLFENISSASIDPEFADWIFEEERKPGEAGLVEMSEDEQYLIYYIGEGDAQWHAQVEETLVSDRVSEYVQNLSDAVVVNDPRGNLNYLKVEAASQEEDADSEE